VMGFNRVQRGGGWYCYAFNSRITDRDNGRPDVTNDGYGFRCVLPPGVQ